MLYRKSVGLAPTDSGTSLLAFHKGAPLPNMSSRNAFRVAASLFIVILFGAAIVLRVDNGSLDAQDDEIGRAHV